MSLAKLPAPVVTLGAAAVGLALVLAWLKLSARPGQTVAASIGEHLGQTVAGTVIDAGTGAVVGIGKAVGIPATSETECQKAKREGRTWDASFACPAGEFITYLFD